MFALKVRPLYTLSMDIELISKWLGSGSINIFGRPFAGKDTHGRELVELFNGVLLGGGDIIRNSNIPAHIKAIADAGKLIPTEDYIDIVLPYLSKPEFDGKPLILSSVGRWHGEEEGVIGAAEAANHPIKAVILLNISEEDVFKRHEAHVNLGDRGNRLDDTEDFLEVRLAEYREKTLPVIEYYKKAGLLIDVDSTLSKQAVFDLIIESLHQRATQN